MSYSGLIVQVLISAPGDLPPAHREIVVRAMRVWNTTYGRVFGIHFSPTDWKEGSNPAFGEYPQAVLNEQIVDDSDIAIVIFTDRLGTPTPDHESGTVEEIERMLKKGKDVAVLLNNCPRAPSRGGEDQSAKLAEYLKVVQKKAFTGAYASDEELRQSLEQLLGRMANKYKREAEAAKVPQPPALPKADLADESSEIAKGVWPRIEVSERAGVDSRGNPRTSKDWYLVLESTYSTPVTNVQHHFEDANGELLTAFDLFADRRGLTEILPPKGSLRFPMAVTFGMPPSAICVVTYCDSNGNEQSTRATVRI
ncbi:hypothetical protein SZ00_02600 [Rhodococcus sp. AD45]|nr:hypothetical protein SZ00_02600 [Rhodococcus sp. AD45]